jgi:hypothetical protein
VEPVQLGDRHRDQLLEIRRIRDRHCERANGGLVEREIVVHDRTHDLDQLLAVAEPEWIDLWERVLHQVQGTATAMTSGYTRNLKRELLSTILRHQVLVHELPPLRP